MEEREGRREGVERRQRAWVLELVIGWDEGRREGGEVGGRSGKGEVSGPRIPGTRRAGGEYRESAACVAPEGRER